MKLLTAIMIVAVLCMPAWAQNVIINEIRIDQLSTDTDEYFELAGTSGLSLGGLSYIVIGDATPAGAGGAVEAIIPLDGLSIPADGFFLAVEADLWSETLAPLSDADLQLTSNALNFENSDNVTHMLVSGLHPAINTGTGYGGTDLDVDDDGVIDALIDTDGDTIPDSPPFAAVLDSIALVETPGSGDLYYGTATIGPDGPYVPGHVYRFPNDGTGTWFIGIFDIAVGQDTPGSANAPPTPSAESGAVLAYENDTDIAVNLDPLVSGGIPPLTTIITQLPAAGTLKDAGTPIGAVPYVNTSGLDLTYDPPANFTGTPYLKFKARDSEGTESQEARFYICVQDNKIVITEIMNRPYGPDSVYEYIEVYNYSASTVGLGALAGNLLDDASTAGTFTGKWIGADQMKILAPANTGGLDEEFRCDWGLRKDPPYGVNEIIRVDLGTWEGIAGDSSLIALYDANTGGLLDAVFPDQDEWTWAGEFKDGQSLTIWDSFTYQFVEDPDSRNNDDQLNWQRAGDDASEYAGGLQTSFVQENKGNPGFIYKLNPGYQPLTGDDSCFQECCLPEGGCLLVTQDVCQNEMCGDWQPDDANCGSSPPSCSFDVRACCIDSAGCRELNACQCGLADGDFTTHGDCATAGCPPPTTVEINELDYDQPGTVPHPYDWQEFIELIGPPGHDLTGWSIELYNGATSLTYRTISLDGQTIPSDGFFVIGSVKVVNRDMTFTYETDNIQNGDPDGIVLCNGTTPVELLAYEGGMTVEDPCASTLGLTSLPDVGIRDSGAPDLGSLQKLPDSGLWSETETTTPGVTNSRFEVTGACCEFLAGCQGNRTASDCGTSGAIWYPNADCATVGCPDPLGACCLPGGQCRDLTAQAECEDDLCGQFHSGDVCSSGGGTVTCSPLPTEGCCLPSSGDCGDITTCGCQQLGGTIVPGGCGTVGCPAPTTVTVNEIDYDQPGGDTAEFIELVGPPDTDLADWRIDLYNGNGNVIYRRIELTGYTIPLDRFFVIGTEGVLNVDLSIAPVSDGWFQNGDPDGVVLCNGNTPVDWFAYEGDMVLDDICTSGAGPYVLADIGPSDSGQDGSIQRLPNGGIWTWTPDALTPGESNTATVATGACCEPLGACTEDETRSACLSRAGTWFEAETCPPAAGCPPPKGACCQPDGGCIDFVSSNGCHDYCYNSVWHQAQACTSGLCAPQPTGQCCMYIGVCIEVAECECTDLDPQVLSGNWDGDADCTTAECDVLGSVAINEIRIDQPGSDTEEYFELVGTPRMSLNGLTYVVLGDGDGGSGTIEAAIDLHNQVISTNGFFLAAEDNDTYAAVADLITTLNFENGDNLTHLLVAGFTGQVDDDLDLDVTTNGGDGILDITPWAAIVDSVALVEDDPPQGPEQEHPYSDTIVGPDCVYVPAHVFRIPDQTGDWQIGPFDGGYDTPGASNAGAIPVTGARSWRDHGTARALTPRPIDLFTTSKVEPRLGGVQTIELDLVTSVSSVSASVCCLNDFYDGIVTVVTPPPEGTLVTITFDGPLPDQDCCVITLSGDVNARLPVTTLVGDVNRDGQVSTADSSSVKARLEDLVTDGNCQYDVNNDGMISTADKSSVKARLERIAPGCP